MLLGLVMGAILCGCNKEAGTDTTVPANTNAPAAPSTNAP